MRTALLARESRKQLQQYLQGRLWFWATKQNFALSTDYAIHLLNSSSKDPLGLAVGTEIAKYSGQSALAEKCEQAARRLAFIKDVKDVCDLIPPDGQPSPEDIRFWRQDLHDTYSKMNGALAPIEESLSVTNSATLSTIQKHCVTASLRVSPEPLVEVLEPSESIYGRGLYALRRVNAGKCLLLDEPLMVQAGSSSVCAHCLSPLNGMGGGERGAVECQHCESERYCSTACREAAWESNHCCCCASQNPQYAQWSKSVMEGAVKDKGKGWSDSTSPYRAALASLAVAKLCAMATVKQCHPLSLDGMDYLRGVADYDRETALSEVGNLAVMLSTAFRQPYLFMEDTLSLFAVLQSNEFVVDGNIALYPLLSLLNHSCCPNCKVVGTAGRPTKRQLVALKDIREGEQLMIDYNSALISTLSFEDRKALCAQRHFVCFCQKCIRKE